MLKLWFRYCVMVVGCLVVLSGCEGCSSCTRTPRGPDINGAIGLGEKYFLAQVTVGYTESCPTISSVTGEAKYTDYYYLLQTDSLNKIDVTEDWEKLDDIIDSNDSGRVYQNYIENKAIVLRQSNKFNGFDMFVFDPERKPMFQKLKPIVFDVDYWGSSNVENNNFADIKQWSSSDTFIVKVGWQKFYLLDIKNGGGRVFEPSKDGFSESLCWLDFFGNKTKLWGVKLYDSSAISFVSNKKDSINYELFKNKNGEYYGECDSNMFSVYSIDYNPKSKNSIGSSLVNDFQFNQWGGGGVYFLMNDFEIKLKNFTDNELLSKFEMNGLDIFNNYTNTSVTYPPVSTWRASW